MVPNGGSKRRVAGRVMSQPVLNTHRTHQAQRYSFRPCRWAGGEFSALLCGGQMLYPIVETQRSLLKPLAMWDAGASASSSRFISAAIQSRSRWYVVIELLPISLRNN